MSDFGLFLHRHAELFLGLSLIVNGVLLFRWFLEHMENKQQQKSEYDQRDHVTDETLSFETFEPYQRKSDPRSPYDTPRS